MPSIDADDGGGGRLLDGPADLSARGRTRNGERWLETPPLPDDATADDATADDASADGPEVAARIDLLGALVERARVDRCTAVHWESDDPAGPVDAVARAIGLDERRDILQLRRPLPLGADVVAGAPAVELRPFRPGSPDEKAWVRVNNRAFAAHPDQGQESVSSLRSAMAEPWFDPAGLLLAEGDPAVDDGGDLDGFCWTKVHPAVDGEPTLGEIYVIGIDPGVEGRGLGRALTVAGLVHLSDGGVPVAMLFVDADNTPARRLYDRLGFATHHTRRVRSLRLV